MTGTWRRAATTRACVSGGNLASMRMNTLENNQLDDLCLLLPEQNRLVLRGGCSSTAGVGLAAAGCGDPAAGC